MMLRPACVLTVLAVLSLCILSSGCFTDDSGNEQSEYFEMEKQVFNLINEYRAEQGLVKLDYSKTVSSQCLKHSEGMASGEVEFSHDGFPDRAAILKEELGSGSAAENVAYNWGQTDPVQTAVDGWINSTGHKNNIEGGYTLTGVGIAMSGDGKYYFTQMFYKVS
jgi:uncharacterized protein YkwD